VESNRERSTTEDRVIQYLIEWICSITHKPKEEYQHMGPEELYEILNELNPDMSTRPSKKRSTEN
jgi:hypothetical protein